MKDEATANAETDRKAKEEVDKLNTADTLVFSTEKQLKEYGDKIPAEKKQAIEDACNQLKTAQQNKDFAAIDTASEALNNAWQAASQDMYNATQGEQQPGAEGQANQETPKDKEVTDVDFEEVK